MRPVTNRRLQLITRTGPLLVLFLILGSTLCPAQTSGSAWEPKRTWAFVVGLLEWKDRESFESFPKENRRDEILLSVLAKRGVPASQTLYLQDKAATTREINAEFLKMLGRTQPGDTILVYYEGHGYKDDDGKAYFASYDTDDVRNPGWLMSSVPEAIERNFKGERAIIALDNCYSGSMVTAVKSRKRRVSYAVMASSSATHSSTGNWTFTEALISAFRGSPVADDDNDGVVTFAELEANAEADMLFGEEQVSSFAFTGSFDPNTKVADAVLTATARVGERVEAYSEGDWYKGYIIDSRGGKFLIHYYGYEQSDDEWLSAASIRVPHVGSAFKIGERVQVEYKRRWYPAHILSVKGNSHYVSYDDYDTDENEWVSTKRIRRIQ